MTRIDSARDRGGSDGIDRLALPQISCYLAEIAIKAEAEAMHAALGELPPILTISLQVLSG